MGLANTVRIHCPMPAPRPRLSHACWPSPLQALNKGIGPLGAGHLVARLSRWRDVAVKATAESFH